MTKGSFRQHVGRAATAATLAVAALSLSGCGLLDIAGAIPQEAPAPTTGETTEADVFTIDVGNCLPSESGGTGEVTTVETVSCDDPHDSEAYAAGDMPDGEYPGEAEIEEFSDDLCMREFETFVGLSYEESVLNYWTFTPTEGSWASGDREVLCLVFDPEGDTTGTLRGAAR